LQLTTVPGQFNPTAKLSHKNRGQLKRLTLGCAVTEEALLNSPPDLHLGHQADSIAEALAIAASHALDLAVVDTALSKDSGLDLTMTQRRRYPRIALLVMSLHDQSAFAERALEAGANGCLMKQEATAKLLLAIRRALAGEIYLSPAMQSRLTRWLSAPKPQSSRPIAGFSGHELELLHLI